MSRVTGYRPVLKERLNEDFELPKEQQQIVRVVTSRDNNLYEVESSQLSVSNPFLVSLPNNFRQNVWIKRGDYMLVEPIEELGQVKAEICKILTKQHVEKYTKAGIWPKKFTMKRPHEDLPTDIDSNEFLIRNHNRPVALQNDIESEDDEKQTSENI